MRAKKKVEEIERLLEIARSNYLQLGYLKLNNLLLRKKLIENVIRR